MSDKNEIDRWRKSLEEAERELESKNKQLLDMQDFAIEKISTLIRQQDVGESLSVELSELKKADSHEDFESSIETIITKATKLPRDIALIDDSGDDIKNKHGEELLEILAAMEKSSIDTTNTKFIELKENVVRINSKNDIEICVNDLILFWQETTQRAEKDPSQFCALLISEILYQLLEKISLPEDLSERLAGLKTQLQEGVTMSNWGNMLNEVSEMASDVQLKINHERLDIEVFLKQVMGRLKELDDYVQGSKNNLEKSKDHGIALGDAVKKEMKNLVSSTHGELDIKSLKQQVQSGITAIEKHIDEFKKVEGEQHSSADKEVQALLERLATLEQESTALKSRVHKERMQAQTDALTGIANRLGYDQHVAQEYARWKRFKNPLTLVVWDIDFFKRINDDYGHAAGDKALKTIATLLTKNVRETDYLARYGGEEFVLIMPGADSSSAEGVAEKLRGTVESSGFHFKGAPVSITMSAGIAEFGNGDTPQQVFERADRALYKAKENGRNQVVISDE